MGPRTLTEDEWSELREAIAAWRATRRSITTLITTVVLLLCSVIAWGVSVENRLTSVTKNDENLKESVNEIKAGQREIITSINLMKEALVRHLENGNGKR
jgi:predicted negative regulator of RcsB-dependent stress response